VKDYKLERESELRLEVSNCPVSVLVSISIYGVAAVIILCMVLCFISCSLELLRYLEQN